MARHTQQIHMSAIGVDVGGQNAGGLGRFEHHGTGAVAKQHAGGAVLKIQNTGKNLSAHHQRTARATGADHGVGHGQGINKAAAYRLHIKRRTAGRPQFALQNAGRGRENHVRRRGGNNDQVHIACAASCRFERLAASLQG